MQEINKEQTYSMNEEQKTMLTKTTSQMYIQIIGNKNEVKFYNLVNIPSPLETVGSNDFLKLKVKKVAR